VRSDQVAVALELRPDFGMSAGDGRHDR
jgi:hypothetical protein